MTPRTEQRVQRAVDERVQEQAARQREAVRGLAQTALQGARALSTSATGAARASLPSSRTSTHQAGMKPPRLQTDEERLAMVRARREVLAAGRRRWEEQQRAANARALPHPTAASLTSRGAVHSEEGAMGGARRGEHAGGTAPTASGDAEARRSDCSSACRPASSPLTQPWLLKLLAPEPANLAARKSVRSPGARYSNIPGDGTTAGASFQKVKDPEFHISRHTQPGTIVHERFRRGIPPGYSGYVPLHVEHNAPPAAYKPTGGPPPPIAYTRTSIGATEPAQPTTPRGGPLVVRV